MCVILNSDLLSTDALKTEKQEKQNKTTTTTKKTPPPPTSRKKQQKQTKKTEESNTHTKPSNWFCQDLTGIRPETLLFLSALLCLQVPNKGNSRYPLG